MGDVYYEVLVVEGKHLPKRRREGGWGTCFHAAVLAKSLELLPVKGRLISSVTGRGGSSLVLLLLTFGQSAATTAHGDGENGGAAERRLWLWEHHVILFVASGASGPGQSGSERLRLRCRRERPEAAFFSDNN